MTQRTKAAVILIILLIAYLYITQPALFTYFSRMASFKIPTFHIGIGNTTDVHAASVKDISIVGTPDMSVAQINDVLTKASSPARGTGQALYTGSATSHIKASFALAVFKHESGYGTAGMARSTHSLGNIRCSAGYACIGGYRSYVSWEVGYTDFYTLIRTLYISHLGLNTVGQVMSTYAPTSENNTSGYIADVISSMNTWEGK